MHVRGISNAVGLFWRKLQMDLSSVGDILSAAALLHNFIVDERDEDSLDYFASFNHGNLTSESEDFQSSDTPMATVTGNNEQKPPGRHITHDKESKDRGTTMRRTIAWTLQELGLTRPVLFSVL
jgi:hypothetical protein